MPDFSEEADEVQFFKASSPSTDSSPESVPTSSIIELPLFPLGLVLNPGTNIPLHIFELRYRLLFNRVRDGDSRFGIVLLDGKTNSIALVGCTAQLTHFEPLPDGRIMTNNVAQQRFRIIRIIDEKPYTRAIVENVSDEEPKEDLSALVKEVWQALEDVLRLSNKLYDKVHELSPDIKRLAPDGVLIDDEKEGKRADGRPSPKILEEFSFAVCQVLEMPVKDQQIMLQMTDTAARFRRQSKMLSTARQYLAAQVTIKEAGLKEW